MLVQFNRECTKAMSSIPNWIYLCQESNWTKKSAALESTQFNNLNKNKPSTKEENIYWVLYTGHLAFLITLWGTQRHISHMEAEDRFRKETAGPE